MGRVWKFSKHFFPNFPVKLVEWQEGKAHIFVPDPQEYGHPNHMPVFFNPRARVSRDVSTLVLSVLDVHEVLDAMAATGVRGIRYALEAGKQVFFNDIDERAVVLIRKNLQKNKIDAEVLQGDANVLLHSRSFECVDIDPFGSPAPFLHAAARSIRHGGVLLVTATDTAPLFGASPNAAKRKYLAITRRVPWEKEMGVRILLANVFHALGIYEKGMIPLISFVHEHHVRVIVKVLRRPSLVTRNAKNIGIVDGVGPIWLGPLHNTDVLSSALSRWSPDTYSREAKRIIALASEELPVVGYYDLHHIARSLKLRSVPPVEKVIHSLKERGFMATRTVFSPTAIKTNAELQELEDLLKSLL